jgi:hypothetical protein
MGDFLTGARWGAWFILAAITAAALWTIVHWKASQIRSKSVWHQKAVTYVRR